MHYKLINITLVNVNFNCIVMSRQLLNDNEIMYMISWHFSYFQHTCSRNFKETFSYHCIKMVVKFSVYNHL